MITKDELMEAALAARISLDNTQVDKFTRSINDILAFVDMIYEKDRGQGENFDGFAGHFREDVVMPSLTNECALSGTEFKEEGYFAVSVGEKGKDV